MSWKSEVLEGALQRAACRGARLAKAQELVERLGAERRIRILAPDDDEAAE
jgi:hypothetical protein